MRAKAVEIRWHNTKPIYSADFQPSPPSNLSTLLQKKAAHPYALSEEEKQREQLAQEHGKVWRLATAGGDNMVMTWLVHPNPALTLPSAIPASDASAAPGAKPPAPAPVVEYLATLAKHLGVVNVVRFCPKGEVLASGGDDGNVLLWVLSSGQGAMAFGETQEDRQYERESWRTRLMLRGPAQCEIYDIAWSPSGDFLLTGDTAKTARIWNATDGQCIKQITEHSNFVQGVAWDPLGQYIATQSSDRTMHIYSITIQKDHSGAAVADCHHVGKHAKMDVVNNPGGSWSSSPSSTTSAQLPSLPQSTAPAPTSANPVRPTPARSLSAMSDVSMRSEASSSVLHPPPRPPSTASASATGSLAPPTPSTSSMQPPSEIPHHPHISHVHAASIAPARSHSRQSSSSTHASPALSATTGARIARSPSPAPPLPAVSIEAEHHFRPSSSSTSSGGGAGGHGVGGNGEWSLDSFKGREKATIKLYGDEGASAFFRRLGFSTDGALLLSPAGKWEDPWLNANGDASAGTRGKGKGKGKEAEEEVGGGNAGSGGKKKRKIALLHHGTSTAGNDAAAGGEKPTVYIYGRASMGAGKSPLAHLPGHRTSSVAIRFSPVVYRLREGVKAVGGAGRKAVEVDLQKGKTVEVSLEANGTANGETTAPAEGGAEGEEGTSMASAFALPYRMLYAVATHDAVFVYDTQQSGPICMFGNLHYASFTDVAWTADGQTLVLCSSDGYCSLVAFDEGDLGTPMDLPPPPASALSAPSSTPSGLGSSSTKAAQGQTTLKAFVQTSPSSRPSKSPQPLLPSTLPPISPPTSSLQAAPAPGPVSVTEAAAGAEVEEPKKKKRRVPLTFEGSTA